MTLEDLPVGKTAMITAVGGEGALRCRLLDMGLIPGLTIRVEDAKKIEIDGVKEAGGAL